MIKLRIMVDHLDPEDATDPVKNQSFEVLVSDLEDDKFFKLAKELDKTTSPLLAKLFDTLVLYTKTRCLGMTLQEVGGAPPVTPEGLGSYVEGAVKDWKEAKGESEDGS